MGFWEKFCSRGENPCVLENYFQEENSMILGIYIFKWCKSSCNFGKKIHISKWVFWKIILEDGV